MLIFVPNITPRHQYVFSHIFNYLGIEFNITNDKETFQQSGFCKLSYSGKALFEELFIKASGFLNRNDIESFTSSVGEHEGVKTLFENTDDPGCLPYDIFSAVFYMLSRYEEYLPFEADCHGRFEAANSLAFKEGFLYKPVVDLWITQLAQILKNKFPELKLKKHQYKFIPTYDIDIAWSYKHKGYARNLGGLLRDAIQLKFASYFQRLFVLFNLKPDPFDSYDYLFGLEENNNLHPIFFFHPGTYGQFDKNIPAGNKHIKKLLKRISSKASLGIHPSYRSAENPELLSLEKQKLEDATGIEITVARQHFIKIKFPHTYRNYISNGITDDYSMGFATDIGFRAGTSNPFLFFDVLENKTTGLLIHPFVFMEGVYRFYKNIPEKDIIDSIAPLIQQIKQTNGTFISLWHNESLGTSKAWKGWRNIYKAMINAAK